MRVISGEARGRKFLAPKMDSVRPTSDRVREAIFDVLGHLGGLVGARVLDLFAGSGAFGIESLSRGAMGAVFVDQDREVIRTIKDNLVAVKLDDASKIEVIQNDAIAYCRVHSNAHAFTAGTAGEPLPLDSRPRGEGFDITFCDPPYSFVNWPKLLGVIPGDLLVLEHSGPLALPENFDVYRVYRYGSTLVTVANRRRGPEGEIVLSQEVLEPQ
ncbi:MAG TPA: RsmD family RNA methyltransferase [Acidimicrobiales bacterium]|nr:RsmD family RNA methyltransferase [Acidimicrobiales bacterium]